MIREKNNARRNQRTNSGIRVASQLVLTFVAFGQYGFVCQVDPSSVGKGKKSNLKMSGNATIALSWSLAFPCSFLPISIKMVGPNKILSNN